MTRNQQRLFELIKLDKYDLDLSDEDMDDIKQHITKMDDDSRLLGMIGKWSREFINYGSRAT